MLGKRKVTQRPLPAHVNLLALIARQAVGRIENPIGCRIEASGQRGACRAVGLCMNFSLKDRKMVDTLLGFEYDSGCWLGRVVYERLQSTTSTSRSRILFQLEFVGLARVGSSPLKTLRDNIPRYQYLREDLAPTTRFTTYD